MFKSTFIYFKLINFLIPFMCGAFKDSRIPPPPLPLSFVFYNAHVIMLIPILCSTCSTVPTVLQLPPPLQLLNQIS